MARLLVVHHTPSPAVHDMVEAATAGARDPAIDGVEVVVRPALHATASDVLDADGYLLGAPANLGYMAGALKHFFDPSTTRASPRPSAGRTALFVHGNLDVDGAILAVEKIVTGLQWVRVQAPVSVVGQPRAADLEACYELGAAVAAGLVL